MADSMQPKRLNINNNIDQSKTVLDSNENTFVLFKETMSSASEAAHE